MGKNSTRHGKTVDVKAPDAKTLDVRDGETRLPVRRSDSSPLLDCVLSGTFNLPREQRRQRPFLRHLRRAATSRDFSQTIQNFRDSVIRSVLKGRGEGEIEQGLTIAVSGARGNEGSSFLSLLLALSLGSSRHYRVAYIDGRFNMQRFDALTNVLALSEDSIKVEKSTSEVAAFFNEAQPNICFLKSTEDENSLDFFSDKELSTFMDNLREKFDFTVIDMPPLLAESSSVYIAPAVDRLYLAVSAGKTRLADVDQCIAVAEEAGIEISGVVLNNQDIPVLSRLFWKEYFF